MLFRLPKNGQEIIPDQKYPIECDPKNLASTDGVTIALFSQELNNGSYSEYVFKEEENIRKMQQNFWKIAKENRKTPPQFFISVLLIPNWGKKGNSYDNLEYKELKNTFFARLREEFKGIVATIQDFYVDSNLSPDEKAYMYGLPGSGSNLDIIKIRALLNNQNARHLQIDSNTKIHDFKELYRKTFGAPDEEQQDSITASCYAFYYHYVSGNNKVIYSAGKENGIVSYLKSSYLTWCKENKDNLSEKEFRKNSIYDGPFINTLLALDLVKKVPMTRTVRDFKSNELITIGRVCYPANLLKPQYRITSDIISAVNMTWSNTGAPSINMDGEFKSLPGVLIGDAYCDLACFANVIKKFTGDLSQHDLSIVDSSSQTRKQLLKISNIDVEEQLIVKFYLNVCRENPLLTKELAMIITDNEEGNALTEKLFGCSLQKLHETPMYPLFYSF